MPAVAEQKLSLAEFHARYDGEKPYFEYWDGEAVQKSIHTWLHGLIQTILVQLLNALGYQANLEITLKLDPSYEPIPDVIALEAPPAGRYPTEPFEVAIEILSPDDPFSRVTSKCHLYNAWGIRQVIVVDPQRRTVWSFDNGSLRETDIVARRGDQVIMAQDLWAEVDRRSRPGTAQ